MVPQARSTVLWEQLAVPGTGIVDQEFPDDPGYSSYQASDVSVAPGGWIIRSVSTFYTTGYGNWPSVADVRLSIFSKSGPLPLAGDDPTGGAVYSADLTHDGADLIVRLDGLEIPLSQGDYWIGLTPIIDFGTWGQEFHSLAAYQIGDPTAIRNPLGGFGFGEDWTTYSGMGLGFGDGDAALRVEGVSVVPEPATVFLIVLGIGALGSARRRRS
jgi:hypothetical protein